MQTVIHIMYMVASVLFIVGIKQLSTVKTARSANAFSAFAMLIAIVAAMMDIAQHSQIDWVWVGIGLVAGSAIGAYLAATVRMEGMPELVGFFNGMGGLASCLVAISMSVFAWLSWGGALSAGTLTEVTTAGLANLAPEQISAVLASQADAPRLTADNLVTIVLSILVGGVTLTGSLIAWAKLKGVMSGGQIFLPGHQAINLALLAIVLVAGALIYFVIPLAETSYLYPLLGVAVAASFILGVTFAIPVGGADMPVVISLLNSFSGIAAAMTGFVLYNNLLIISGSLVGAAGMILTIIMCRGMNRSLANVLFARFTVVGGPKVEYVNVKSGDPVDAAIALSNASNVIMVPGYGLAAAQAQHAVRELADMLEERGVNVRYAIHEVAGRMPGHMNVLLAEANVPYDRLYKREDIEADFKNSDVVMVIGANDVVNPAALDDENCPLYGMPILPAHAAAQAFVIKRSLASGFAGMKNKLFESDKTLMVFGSAKEVVNGIIEQLKEQ
jgi:NAD(P) transhydrogenase subunit beta